MASRPTPTPRRTSHPERGATLFEYALVLALIAAVCILTVALTGTKASKVFSMVGATTGAGYPACGQSAGAIGVSGPASSTTTSSIPAGSQSAGSPSGC